MDQLHSSSQKDDLERKYYEAQERIAKLQQRTETQEYELQEQTGRIEKLEQHLVETQAQLTRISQFDEQLNRFRQDLLQIAEQQDNRRPQGSADYGNVLAAQLDSHTQTLHQLRREVDKTQRYDEQIELARTEVERLHTEVDKFQLQLNELDRQLDERVRTVGYLEEQRRVDAQRLAELQVELSRLHSKVEGSVSKIQLVEQQMSQLGKYEIALEDMRKEIRHHREQIDFQIAQRERQLRDWTELAEEQERRMDEYKSLMEKYTEHHQLNQRALASLQDFQERLERSQHQATELQRLAEERQQAEIGRFQANQEQRWQTQVMEWEPRLLDLQKSINTLKEQLHEISQSNRSVQTQIEMILQITEEDIQSRVMASQAWQQRFEEIADGQD